MRFSVGIALVAGALNVYAFAPYSWWPLQLGCVAILFVMVMRASSVGEAALLGWLYSVAWTCAGVYWLYISLHDLGGMPAWLTVLAIALLGCGLGLIVGIATGGARWLQQRWGSGSTATLLLILPALWMLAEWTRGWIFTGFPWLSTGYAHTDAPLAGFAPLIGVYGISWIAALISAGLAMLATIRLGGDLGQRNFRNFRNSQNASARSTARASLGGTNAYAFPLAPMLLPLFCLIALPLALGQALRHIDWTSPQGQPITVRLLQGNIAQEMKFNSDQLSTSLAVYQTMVTKAAADLIVTPETALPVVEQQLPPAYLPNLIQFARAAGSTLLLGIPVSDAAGDAVGDATGEYTNSLLAFAPTAPAAASTSVVPSYRYNKHHLVPFGEFIPTGFRWFVDAMQMPLGDQTRGAVLQAAIAVKDQRVLPNICYEDLFGEEIAAQIRALSHDRAQAPTILLNISNIAWFGDSIAVPQHLQISRMRTLETGRPMLRATNTGATAVIDQHGRIQAQLAPYTRGTLATTVQGYQGMTPYIYFGNSAIVWLAACLLIAAYAGAGLIGIRGSGR